MRAAAQHSDQLHGLLSCGDCLDGFQALVMEQDTVIRSRGLACLIDCASASPDAAQTVLDSGAGTNT